MPAVRDIPAVCRLPRHNFDLTLPESGTLWLMQCVARQRLSPSPGAGRVRVAKLDGRVEAAAVFQVLEPDARWQLDLLGVRDEIDDRATDAALRCAVQDAGRSGARRLFARLPDGIGDERALRRSGFVPYMTEHILRYDGTGSVSAEDDRSVRRLHPADVWNVHQLYLEIVPRQVQYAEAMTSRAWERSQPLRPGMRRASGWVLEDCGRIRGFARISTMEHAATLRLDLLIAPDVLHDADRLVTAAVQEAEHLHGMPCIAVVPGYEGELVQMLQRLNFESYGRQTAFVCYTTVSSRAQVVAVNPGIPVAPQPRPVPVPGLGTAGANAVYQGELYMGAALDEPAWLDMDF